MSLLFLTFLFPLLGWLLLAFSLGRLGEPEDIAALALFLASDEAGYINGGLCRADGGMSCAVPHVQIVRNLL